MTEALPTVVSVTQAFSQRLPAQRVIDLLSKVEGGANFGDLAQAQPFRIIAFRALVRDFPDYDATALWLHSYDVEVEVAEVPLANGSTPTPGPPSAATGVSIPTT